MKLIFAVGMAMMVATAAFGYGIDVSPIPESHSALPGDPFWRPSLEQVEQWVDGAVTAAAAGMYLPEMPAIQREGWSSSDGVACGAGLRLRFALAISPEVVATVAGWEAAMNADRWPRIQTDRAGVVAEVARAVFDEETGSQILIVYGGSQDGEIANGSSLRYTFVRNGFWEELGSVSPVPLSQIARFGPRTGPATNDWAAAFLLSQCADLPALRDPDRVWVARGKLMHIAPEVHADVVHGWSRAIGLPSLPAGTVRTFIGTEAETEGGILGEGGTPGEYAWCDLSIP